MSSMLTPSTDRSANSVWPARSRAARVRTRRRSGRGLAGVREAPARVAFLTMWSIMDYVVKNTSHAPERLSMTLEVDVFWSFRSPYSYLATPRLAELAAAYDVELRIRPVYP